MPIKGDSVKFPAHADGVRYIVVVTREAIEAAAGAQITTEGMASWVSKNIDDLMRVADRVRPRPTAVGARVYIKSHHFNGQLERESRD